jgi:four helix bundle protein
MAQKLLFAEVMAWSKVSDIEAWNLSMRLAEAFGAVLDGSPACEHRKFCEDAHDAVESPARNIAEGFGRYGHREFARFVEIAYASQLETHTNLITARRRAFISDAEYERLRALSEEAKATTVGLLKSLKRRIAAEDRQRRHVR